MATSPSLCLAVRSCLLENFPRSCAPAEISPGNFKKIMSKSSDEREAEYLKHLDKATFSHCWCDVWRLPFSWMLTFRNLFGVVSSRNSGLKGAVHRSCCSNQEAFVPDVPMENRLISSLHSRKMRKLLWRSAWQTLGRKDVANSMRWLFGHLKIKCTLNPTQHTPRLQLLRESWFTFVYIYIHNHIFLFIYIFVFI